MTPTPASPTAPAAAPTPTPAPAAAPVAPEANPFQLPREAWQSNEALNPYAKQLEKFADPTTGVLDVAKLGAGYANLEKFKGGPAPTAVPVEDYLKGVAVPKLPEGFEYPEQLRNNLATQAHAAGVSTEAFNALQEAFVAEQVQMHVAAQTARMQQGAADYAALEAEVGGAHKMGPYIDQAKHAAELLGFDLDMTERTPERVAEIKAFAHIATRIGEAVLPAGGGSVAPSGAGALAAAKDIAQNPNNHLHAAYRDPNNPGHRDAHLEHDRLLMEATRSAGAGNIPGIHGGGPI